MHCLRHLKSFEKYCKIINCMNLSITMEMKEKGECIKKMKKALVLALCAALCLSVFTACGSSKKSSSEDSKKIVIGASPSPHADILKVAAKELKKQGYTLEIKEYSDYVQPNTALDSGDLNANYFQHITYMKNFNKEKGTKLVSAAIVHYEPFGIFPGKTKKLEDLKNGASIAVPNDTTNEARALLLLEAKGLITLKKNAGLTATKKDIVKNPKNLEIKEIEAAQIPRSLKDVDFAVINGNYAIQAGLKVDKDALAIEDKGSVGAKNYGNVIAVRKGDENKDSIKALVKAVKSDAVKKYIEEHYNGAVVPLF